MFSFFEPSYIQEARLVLKNARKLLHYKRDLLSEANIATFETGISRLEQAIRSRDRDEVAAAAQDLDKQWGQYVPPVTDAAWRENCEVFLVAIVVAVAVRTFFLQPFTIPTGSMQPTLNGIIGQRTDVPSPNLLRQAVDFVMRGRSYVDVTAKSDDIVLRMTERKMLYFFTFTDVQCEHDSYTIWAPAVTLGNYFGLVPGRQIHAGQPIVRGYIDAGDHVFVDKVSYNFGFPQRGQVIVFKTTGISYIEREMRAQGLEGSEFYIKRLAGLPGDELRVDQPRLYVNGQLAQGFGFERVMGSQGDYHGYTNPPGGAQYLTTPDATFTVPAHSYFAMGDNSGNSSDSRYWGPLPQENMMGRGLIVYWPFWPHGGLVK